jgi:hypothetical protein
MTWFHSIEDWKVAAVMGGVAFLIVLLDRWCEEQEDRAAARDDGEA